jgi:membrane protease YdiL (CAAX protease family)
VIGLWLHFLAPFHAPGLILVGTALPEEILFRALIQNWLMQKFGGTDRVLFVAALIFGVSHLNNSPGPLPNWRYAILATIAGYAYGKVFQRASSVVSSATLHAMVNTVRHVCF